LAQKINGEDDLMVCGQAHDVHSRSRRDGQPNPTLPLWTSPWAVATGSSSSGYEGPASKLPALIFVVSMHDEAAVCRRSLHAGAKGYVMKQEEPEVLPAPIRQSCADRFILVTK